MSEFQLQGWDELKANLDALPARVQKNLLRGATRAAAVTVRDAIKERAPILKSGTKNPHERYPGQLRDSIIAIGVNKPGSAAAGVRIRGSSEALQSVKQAGRALLKHKLKSAAKALSTGLADGYFWRWIEFGSPHNEPPRPFIRQGWDSTKNELVEKMAIYCRERIAKLTHD